MNKVKRRPPGTVHAADLATAIERLVWVSIPDSTVCHTINDNGQPEMHVDVGGHNVEIGIAGFCVEPASPWIRSETAVDRIAESVVKIAKKELGIE